MSLHFSAQSSKGLNKNYVIYLLSHRVVKLVDKRNEREEGRQQGYFPKTGTQVRRCGCVVVGAAAAGGAYYYSTMPPSTPSPTTTVETTAAETSAAAATTTPASLGPATLRYYGVAFIIYQDAATEYQNETNGRVTVQFQGLGNADASSKALATGGEGWDITSNATARLGMLTNANPPVLQPIDVEKIPNWTNTPAEGLASYIQNPEVLKSTYISEDVMGRIKAMLFKDGVAPEWKGGQWVNAKAWGVACGGNFEGIAYLPEFLPYSEEGAKKFTFGYEEKFNPEWKGHVGMQDDVTLAMGWGALMLTYLNQAKFEGFDGGNGKLYQKGHRYRDRLFDPICPKWTHKDLCSGLRFNACSNDL